MTGSGAKKTKLPPIADPIPTPEDISIQSVQKGEAQRRKLKSRRGRRGTILTEGALDVNNKKSVLGD